MSEQSHNKLVNMTPGGACHQGVIWGKSMGVDVVALFETPDGSSAPKAIVKKLNKYGFWLGKTTSEWHIDTLSGYIESNDVSGSLLVGDSIIEVSPVIRWQMFCENTNSIYDNSMPFFDDLARLFKSETILFLPESSFIESKSLDLLDDNCTMLEMKNYLNELGCQSRDPKEIIKSENGCWTSEGYIEHRVRI